MNVLASILLLFLSACAPLNEAALAPTQQGKQLAFDRNKGNCLACHAIEDGESPGNIGPALTKLPTRFKNKQQLREQIQDATVFNTETSMPPYGRNRILTEAEIDAIVEYLWLLN
ncbi:sulfur oxidation c-type cytochrome SoxX [Methylicorpusculum sp.]|uniref:sulfur oxidation c-type cytochrome SoxX n=1 Tax=Methylicorpusculum sp. TaxID=2713644 RepID=UPI002727A075|nr:sulfur oxidation c-type cytochrome SoxX [Methylicorpusculum sp.]MDO8842810.1 sulfur oxidation c-type cytochrome SoxX [Methylicorpusculum sp.]